jgi:hypothetical protein
MTTCSSHGAFTVTGKLALLLAEQRTPLGKAPPGGGPGWNSRALRDNIARALAEIDGLMHLVAHGREDAREAAKARIRQLRVEAGYMRRVRDA